jgi:hypothetical protein
MAFGLRFVGVYAEFFKTAFLWVGIVLGGVLFVIAWRRHRKCIDLRASARRVEEVSPYFTQVRERRSELVSAAAFLQDDAAPDFERAHIERVNQELPRFQHELPPSIQTAGPLLFVIFSLFCYLESQHWVRPLLPHRIHDEGPRAFEEKLPVEGSTWTKKEGSWTSTTGAHIRFENTGSGLWQSFLYVQEEGRPWVAIRCDQYCEWRLRERIQVSFGSVFSRGPAFPIQANVDEAPKAVILVKKGSELIPNATIQVRNQNFLDLQILATDDLELKNVDLIHRFEDQDQLISRFQIKGARLSRDFRLDLSQWKGGTHQVVLRASDYMQSKDSYPLTLIYMDEDFLRSERVRSIQDLITEWVHVLADLLETQADSVLAATLSSRFKEMVYPDRLEENSLRVFVEGLQRLQKRIQSNLLEEKRFRLLPELIESTEKQILYGMSLIFRERTGDVQSQVGAMKDTQKSLQQMLEEMKKTGKLNSDQLQSMFEQLQDQLKQIQDKLNQLPSGPQDDLINRQALEEQVDESKELSDKIEEIQKQLAEGKSEEALRELQSLLNQLSILNKEIERSFNQMQENLDQGALEAAQKYQQSLESLKQRQEELSQEAGNLKKQQENAEEQSFDPKRKAKQEELSKKADELKLKQDQIEAALNEAAQQFEKALESSEFEAVLNSGSLQELQDQAGEKMSLASESFQKRLLPDAEQSSQEATELLKQMSQQMQQNQKNLQQMLQSSPQKEQRGGEGFMSKDYDPTEVIESGGKGQKEKRRKIMDALKQQVEEKYQKSHERYFEDLLQR